MKSLIVAGIDIKKNNACSINFIRTVNAFSLKYKGSVTSFVPDSGSARYPIALEKGVSNLRGFHLSKIPNSLNYFFNTPLIIYHALKNNFDIIYVRFNLLSVFSVALLRLFTNALIVSEHHGWIYDELIAMRCPRILASLFRMLQLWDIKAAHFSRVVISGLKEKCVEHGVEKNKIIVLQNGTRISDFALQDKRASDETGVFVIGFLGNLVPWQGVHIAIQAGALVKEAGIPFKMKIFGSGPELKRLCDLSKSLGLLDTVEFVGEIESNTVPHALSTLDLALAPFVSERNSNIGLSPIKIRDYAAAGLAIISSDIKGISNYDWLIKVKPDEPQELADAIIHLYKNPELRTALQNKARSFAEKNFDHDKILSSFIDELSEKRKNQIGKN